MVKKDFLNDVKHEIDMLKKHATKKELNELNFKTFNPRYPDSCIYGQMTGGCDSGRARVLMNKSCLRIFDFKSHYEEGVDNLMGETYSSIKNKINGDYSGQTWNRNCDNSSTRTYQYLSALEGYICLKGSKANHIIDYLQDKTNSLIL